MRTDLRTCQETAFSYVGGSYVEYFETFAYSDQIHLMPLFHQRIKPRSCLGPLIVGSLGKNGKKIDQWGGRQNRYEGLGLTTDRPQDAPGGSRLSPTGLGLRTD